MNEDELNKKKLEFEAKQEKERLDFMASHEKEKLEINQKCVGSSQHNLPKNKFKNALISLGITGAILIMGQMEMLVSIVLCALLVGGIAILLKKLY